MVCATMSLEMIGFYSEVCLPVSCSVTELEKFMFVN